MQTTKDNYYLSLNLQLFGEGGGDGGTGAEGGATGVTAGVPDLQSKSKGVKANPLANVVYGKQAEATEATGAAEVQSPVAQEKSDGETADRTAEFEKLIKNDYKDLYDARVQETIQKRLKSTKDTVSKYESLTPTLSMLAAKYGVDANDIDALNAAIEEDDSYYEDEALEKGLTVQQLKEIRKMERENSELKKQMQAQDIKERADALYAKWMEDSESLKSVYPSFDLNSEMQNDKFVDLIKNNVDVRTAYEVLHKDEIIPAAMQFTAQKTAQMMTNKIMSNGARPTENGISSQSSAIVKSDVSQLSRTDRAEIIRRVQRGDKISF